MHFSGASELLLRLGVAFALLFPAASAVIDPYTWVGYLPSFLRSFGPEMVFLHLFGLLQAVLGIWLLAAKRVFYPALGAALLLILIVFLNFGDFDLLFRDLSIAAMALALAVAHRRG